jgi:TIR domain
VEDTPFGRYRPPGGWECVVTVFISYSSRDKDAVKSLTQDLQDADEQVWLDQRLAGGDAWWRAILEQIRGCDVLIFALSQNSIESKPCQAELHYAQALRLPILPVQVGPVDSMQLNPLATVQTVDYRSPTPSTAMRLLVALNRTRAQRQPLPSPLPDEPEVPFEYLIRLYTTIGGPDYLSPPDQAALVAQLQFGLREDGDHEAARSDIVMLLSKLRDREDVTYRTRSDVEAILASIDAEPPPQPPTATDAVAKAEGQLGTFTAPVSTGPPPPPPAPEPVWQQPADLHVAATQQRPIGWTPVPPPRLADRPPPDTRTPPRQPRWRRKVNRRTAIAVLAVPVVVCVAAVVFAGATLRLYLADRAVADAQHAIVQTATNAITTMRTYTPENVDTLADRASQYLSGDFEAQYRKYVDAIVAPNKQAQVTETAQVVGAGVESLSGPEASAVIYFNTTSTTPQTRDKPSTKYLSFRLTMQKHDSRWLITKMTTITDLDFVPKSPIPG